MYTQAKFCSFVPVHSIQCSIPELSDAATVRAGSVFVVDYLDSELLQIAAQRGGVILFNGNTSSPMEKAGTAIKLDTDHAVFKTALWLGNPSDNNMGTVAYPTLSDEIAPGAAPDGWADEGWVSLMSSLACLRAS